MKRKWTIGLCVLLLAAVTACTLTPLRVSPRSQTLDIVDSEGGAWAYWQVEGSGDLTIDFGDGSEFARCTIEGRAQISHLYTAAGEYTAKFYRGARSTQVTVAIDVESPVAYELWATQGYNVAERELMRFLIPYREHGCDGSTESPLYVSGVLPGTGATEFMLKVWNQDGERVSVFISRLAPGEESEYNWDGVPVVIENVWGEWLELKEPIGTSLQHVYVFGNWIEDYPHTVVWPDAMAVKTKDGDCGPDPWDVVPVITAEWMDFELCARSAYAISPAAKWRIYISGGDC